MVLIQLAEMILVVRKVLIFILEKSLDVRSGATNFNPNATQNDGSCIMPITSQEIDLPIGWSIFSTYIETENMNVIAFLSGFNLILSW